MKMHRVLLSNLFIITIIFGLAGCLKTRAQLREEPDDREASRPVPAHPVQDVESHGSYAVDELKSEFTRLEGRIEDLERTQKESAGKSGSMDREEYKKLDGRLQQVEQTQATLLEALKKLQESPAIADPVELYKKAMAQYEDEEYELAAQTFTVYLKTPKPKNAEEATFLKGESLYKLKQYKKAIVEYSKFPEKFSHSKRMPDALYRIGLSFDALGMKDDAKGFYQELVEKFPKSPEAKKARKKVK